ncbi:cytosylglucuronate decarboxylase [Streptomyces durhamensis]|uniref:cytosylglucuronate decarboxylase n=1 Tax=Streptomyces durhamensis TaxID=68194 RepID=UPI0004CD118A|nr:cytosylglucuronate decarboxylase [Streptomyces durhamensis]
MTTLPERPRYLFIRILEACNAGCFMCDFAHSRDTYRFTNEDLSELVPKALEEGVRYLRFTGGEPLMHREILPMVRTAAEAGLQVSLITNGMLLPRMADALAEAGLSLVVVSIDGMDAKSHDLFRDARNCFDRAVEGLKLAKSLGIMCRVNSVVGPHNYREMPALQEFLADLGVDQWDLSALKLSQMPTYPDEDDVRRVGERIYADERLRPMGKRWYGETAEEQHRYFVQGVTPRVSQDRCFAAEDVVYLDAKDGSAFVCACLPHRTDGGSNSARFRTGGVVDLGTPRLREMQQHFAAHGPASCTGCNAASARYSDVVAAGSDVPAWAY